MKVTHVDADSFIRDGILSRMTKWVCRCHRRSMKKAANTATLKSTTLCSRAKLVDIDEIARLLHRRFTQATCVCDPRNKRRQWEMFRSKKRS